MKRNFSRALNLGAMAAVIVLGAGCATSSALDQVRSMAQKAQDTAQQALQSSNDAQSTAKAAQQTASAAQDSADSAAQDAQSAQSCCDANTQKMQRMFRQSQQK